MWLLCLPSGDKPPQTDSTTKRLPSLASRSHASLPDKLIPRRKCADVPARHSPCLTVVARSLVCDVRLTHAFVFTGFYAIHPSFAAKMVICHREAKSPDGKLLSIWYKHSVYCHFPIVYIKVLRKDSIMAWIRLITSHYCCADNNSMHHVERNFHNPVSLSFCHFISFIKLPLMINYPSFHALPTTITNVYFVSSLAPM